MPDDARDGALYLDGERITADDLTFREQREMRDIIRNFAPDNDPDKAIEADFVPALIYVWKKRTDKSFSLDQALDIKPADLEKPIEGDPPQHEG